MEATIHGASRVRVAERRCGVGEPVRGDWSGCSGAFCPVKTSSGRQIHACWWRGCNCLGAAKSGQVLALGHSDAVWPVGSVRSMPFRQADGRLWGPGVLDMKAGIVFFVFAVRALRELDIAAGSKVLLQLNPDEEVGSEVSRALTEKNAARSKAVLVLEPGSGLTGKLKTARKGVGNFRVVVKGRASHTQVSIFEAGASAGARNRATDQADRASPNCRAASR